MKETNLLLTIQKTYNVLKVVKSSSKGYFYSFIMEAIFQSIFPYISIYFVYLIIDGIVEDQPINQLLVYVYWMIGLSLLIGLVLNVFRYYSKVFAIELRYNLDNKIASKSFAIDYPILEDNKTMKLITMAEEGCNGNGGLTDYCGNILGGILSSVLSIFYGGLLLLGLLNTTTTNHTSFLARFLNNQWSVLIVAFVIFIPAVVSKYVMKKNNERSYDIMMYNIEGNRIIGYFQQISANYKYGKDIRLYNFQDMFINKMRSLREKADQKWREFSVFRVKMLIVSLSGNKALSFIAYIYVGLKAMYGMISVGNVVAYVAAITLLSQAISMIVERYSRLHLYNNYLENYFTYLNLESTMDYGTYDQIDEEQLSIAFDNVSFKYPNTDDYVLKNINLTIEKGTKLAIVGLNGAGKTTIVKLLCRLYDPTEGEIRINNVPIQAYTKEACNRLFSIVFQDFKLFSYSIKDNISASLHGDTRKVKESLEKTGMMNRVNEMNKNIDTTIFQRSKENGVEISGGEAQKLAISRALYKDAPIVILDEPTAALDPKSEAEVYEKFNHLVENKTAFFISHRMSSCQFCDEVLVLDQGKIVERGHHNKLAFDKGLYSKMWAAQSKYYI